MTQVERILPGSNYTVRLGDSLFLIAQRAYGNAADWPIIYEANRQVIGLNPDVLHTGQVLAIPPAPSPELSFRKEQPIPPAPSPDLRVRPIPPAPSPDLPLRVSTEIQGDVLAPFNKDHRMYLFYGFPDQASGRAWLAELIPFIANTKDVAAFNAAFSAARAANGGVDPPNMQATWVNVSLTFSGLTTLINANSPVASEIKSWSAHFASGPADQFVLTNNGDTGDSDPKNWKFGSDNRIHAMLNIQSDDPTALAAKVHELQALANKHGMQQLWQQDGATLPMPLTGHEHFGFKDGISQPGVAGFDPPDPNDPNPDPSAPLGHVLGHPQAEIIQAGEFILGEAVEVDAGEPQFPPPELQHVDWMKKGSFQVVRRLSQNVPGFWNEITSALPADGSLTADLLGAKVVGRWKSGTPVDLSADQDNNLTDDATINNFIYKGDDPGQRCPRFAHIRKVYPRDHDHFGDRSRRILRRGVPFGLPFAPGGGSGQDANQVRGLFFVAYMASIERQFEFLMVNWARNAGFPPDVPQGLDPIIGASDGGSCTIQRQGQPPLQLAVTSFVATTGTLYTFVPSLPALSQLANGEI